MRLDGGYGFHRHYGKWEVMFGSPSSIIKEANANISRKKRREKDLLWTIVIGAMIICWFAREEESGSGKLKVWSLEVNRDLPSKSIFRSK